VVAVKPDVFRDLTHCNKMYDFVSMRRPVLASRTAAAEAYFDDTCFAWFVGGDADDLACAIRRLHDDPAWARRLVARATEQAEPYRWPHQQQTYLTAVAQTVAA
jgi:glycosyltransferase involved in cell wall biosynthesis